MTDSSCVRDLLLPAAWVQTCRSLLLSAAHWNDCLRHFRFVAQEVLVMPLVRSTESVKAF